MGLLGRLFGTEAAMGAAVKGISEGLDALVYTDEEKAAGAATERSEARKMVVSWMAATQGQNLARRLIALSITGVWLLQYVVAQALDVFAVFSTSPEHLTAASKVMREGAGDMGPAVMLILAFYFAAPHMGDIAKAVTTRYTEKQKEN